MSEDEELAAALRRAAAPGDRAAPEGGHLRARRTARRRGGVALAGAVGLVAAVVLGVPVVVSQQVDAAAPAPVAASSAPPSPTVPSVPVPSVPVPSVPVPSVPVPSVGGPSVAGPSVAAPSSPTASPTPSTAGPPVPAPTPPAPLEPPATAVVPVDPTPTTTTTTDPPGDLPEEVTPVQGGRYWAVFVAVAYEASDARLAEGQAELRRLGYRGGVGDVACTRGAAEVLGLDPQRSYVGLSVLFADRDDAQRFVDAFVPGVVGTAGVTTYCLD